MLKLDLISSVNIALLANLNTCILGYFKKSADDFVRHAT